MTNARRMAAGLRETGAAASTRARIRTRRCSANGGRVSTAAPAPIAAAPSRGRNTRPAATEAYAFGLALLADARRVRHLFDLGDAVGDDFGQLNDRLAQRRVVDDLALDPAAVVGQFFAQRAQFADQKIDLARRMGGNPAQQAAEIIGRKLAVGFGLAQSGRVAPHQFADIAFHLRRRLVAVCSTWSDKIHVSPRRSAARQSGGPRRRWPHENVTTSRLHGAWQAMRTDEGTAIRLLRQIAM